MSPAAEKYQGFLGGQVLKPSPLLPQLAGEAAVPWQVVGVLLFVQSSILR